MKKSAVTQLEKLGDAIRESINCAKTGTVQKVNGKFADIKIKSGAVLAEVPVFYFVTGEEVGLFSPLAKGDTGLLLFFDDNIDGFINSAEKDKEKHSHDISDCIFIPGFLTNSKRMSNPTELILKNKNSKLIMQNGKLSLGNNTVEVLATIESTLEKISSTLTKLTAGLATGTAATGGAVTWTDATFLSGLGTIKGEVDTLKGNIGGLKI
ncbi:MAG TPA: Gp138 family membrane-puncturing spike protein [bacterium]|nr:Gp138 family membrane-puncturing spike protein [bacterium]